MPSEFRLDQEGIRRWLASGLRAGAAYLAGRATEMMPLVNLGTLRRSIGYREGQEDGYPVVYFGVDERIAPHARYIEWGFAPHFVPFSSSQSLEVWARRVAPHWLGAGGVFVGGPNSRLKSSTSGASGLLGGRPRTWRTAGGASEFLPAGKVGYPFLRPTLKEAVESGELERRIAEALRMSAGGGGRG